MTLCKTEITHKCIFLPHLFYVVYQFIKIHKTFDFLVLATSIFIYSGVIKKVQVTIFIGFSYLPYISAFLMFNILVNTTGNLHEHCNTTEVACWISLTLFLKYCIEFLLIIMFHKI